MTEEEHYLRMAEAFDMLSTICKRMRFNDLYLRRAVTDGQLRRIADMFREKADKALGDTSLHQEEYISSWDVGAAAHVLRDYQDGNLCNRADVIMEVRKAQEEKMEQIRELWKAGW